MAKRKFNCCHAKCKKTATHVIHSSRGKLRVCKDCIEVLKFSDEKVEKIK